MANEDKLKAVAESLLASTLEGRANWETLDDHRFQLALPSGVVSIESDHGRSPYTLTVFNQDGTVIESLTSAFDSSGFAPVPMAWNEALSALYEAARDSALDIQGVLDRILKDVEESPSQDDIPF